MRLEAASSLLSTSTATLDDIASRTGFRSVTDFCRVFKKRFGHPPNEWRRTINRALTKEERNINLSKSLKPIRRLARVAVFPTQLLLSRLKGSTGPSTL
jgi:hypothetical protein